MIEFEIRNAGYEARMREILPCLETWFGELMGRLYAEPSRTTPGLLLCGALWGEDYMARFDRYALASILSRRNLDALRGRAEILLFTDGPSHAKLVSRMRGLEAMGIKFRAELIHPAVVEKIPQHPIFKLWTIGVAHQAGIHIAGRHGQDFHMLLGDHVVEDGYYQNLLRLGAQNDGIAQNGISALIDTAGPEFEPYRGADGFLTIPAAELGNIAWRHLHGQTQGALITPETPIPASHHMLWRASDKLYHLNCRMNTAWLSNRLCRTAPTRIPATLDAAVPYFMPRTPHFATAEDGLTFIELSDGNKYVAPDRLPNWEQYAACVWSTANFDRAYLPYLAPLGETPIALDTDEPHWGASEIRTTAAGVVGYVESMHAEACIGFAMAMSRGIGL